VSAATTGSGTGGTATLAPTETEPRVIVKPLPTKSITYDQVLTLIGLAMQTGVFTLVLIPLHQYGRLGRNIAALPGIPISVLWNFTAYRRWTFNSATAAAIGPGSA